jgi:uncharacterized protein YciI
MSTIQPEGAPMEMARYEVVLLKWPVDRADMSEDDAMALHRQHLDHLTSMSREGHMILAGPFDEQPDERLRGLCIYQTGDLTTTRALAESNPAVRAGRFEVEAMYLWCMKGLLPELRAANE